jgi:hypothetical protein
MNDLVVMRYLSSRSDIGTLDMYIFILSALHIRKPSMQSIIRAYFLQYSYSLGPKTRFHPSYDIFY